MNEVRPYKKKDTAAQTKDKISKRNVVERLYGSIHLPDDFDYKKELQNAIIAKYVE